VRRRQEWLTDGTMPSRVSAAFIEKGPSKSTVAVAHERLADAD
jgi:hypothetical protein